jgi:hypothetical protein
MYLVKIVQLADYNYSRSNAPRSILRAILGYIWGTLEAILDFLDELRIFFDFDWMLLALSIKIHIPFYDYLLLG